MSRFARSRVSGQHDVGHEGVITGCDAFSLRSSIADPQGVALPPLQSPTSLSMSLLACTQIYRDKKKLQLDAFLCESKAFSDIVYLCTEITFD